MSGPHLPGNPSKRYRYRKANGIVLLADATPVREHVARLIAWGLPPVSIAEATEGAVTQRWVAALHSGRWQGIAHERAAAVLRVDHRPHPAQRIVLAVGARRRVQALMTLGYPATWQVAQIGHVRNARRWLFQHATTRAEHWFALAELYRELVESGARGPLPRIATLAARSGYAGPLDWDDIDHPDEVPDPTGLYKRRRQQWGQVARERRRRAS